MPRTKGTQFLQDLPYAPRKVVLFRASRLGDLLCAVPAFRALRRALPEASFTLISLPWGKELVERLPYLDRFELFPGYPGMAEEMFDARRTLSFLARMQDEQFDLAIQIHGSGVYSNPFTKMLGARWTVGFRRPQDQFPVLDASFPYPEEGTEVQRLLALTRFLGAPDAGDYTEFPLLPRDHQELEALLSASGVPLGTPLLAIHPGSWFPTRQWPPEMFAEAALLLSKRHNLLPVVTGSDADRPATTQVLELLGGRGIDLVGRTNLGSLAALFRHSRLVLTNDTGPAHLARAVGAPTVIIVGSVPWQRYHSDRDHHYRLAWVEVPCRPCGLHTCPVGYRCLVGVSVEQVVSKAEELLSGTQTRVA